MLRNYSSLAFSQALVLAKLPPATELLYTLFPQLCMLFPPCFVFLAAYSFLGKPSSPSGLGQSCQLEVLIGQCPFPDSICLSDQLMDAFLMLSITKDYVTHTHTHHCTNACPPHPNRKVLKGRDNGCQSSYLHFQCPSLNAYLLLLDTVDI